MPQHFFVTGDPMIYASDALAAAPSDYEYHNSYFLVAHFHQALIGGVVYGMLSGMYYWWPKMFGFKLDEKLGRWAFWFFNIGFYVCFMPHNGFVLCSPAGLAQRCITHMVHSN